MTGTLWIHWTIRLALVCYVIYIAGAMIARDQRVWWKWARGFWTAGAVIFVAHVICAFAFRHNWSHAEAFQHTANVTEEMLFGWRFGEGIYFSYIFTIMWLADAALWWIRPEQYNRRSSWLSLSIHTYMFFIAFNGAIIFEDGVTRWIGIPTCAVLAYLLLRKLQFKTTSTEPVPAEAPPSPKSETSEILETSEA